ncbi:hypothetical protein [Weissella cibaria]|uniref:hypothetical protein n=1 Tax=Weissella cibaria TaxID=137591 RepID=UPI0022E73EBD|nr:hypothetical protein [Weissella cibaria]
MADTAKVIARIKRNTPLTDDALLSEIANDALMSAEGDGFTDSQLEVAAGWLGSHLASIIQSGNSSVKSQKLAVMEVTYRDNADGSSTFLAEYNRMLDKLNGGGVNRAFFV